MADSTVKEKKTAYMRKWRAKNKEHYRIYQREFKRRLRAKQGRKK